MNLKDTPLPAPMPAATRRLVEAFEDFEAGLAQSAADGSRLARLLMQIFVLLREALARFANGVSADAAMLAEAEASLAGVADRARPTVARAPRVRVATGRPAARGVVAADGLVLVVAPFGARARDHVSMEWVRIEWAGFSKSSCRCA
jgi:hypothetical protein